MSTQEEYVRMTIKVPKDVMREIRVVAARHDQRIYETLTQLLRKALDMQKVADA